MDMHVYMHGMCIVYNGTGKWLEETKYSNMSESRILEKIVRICSYIARENNPCIDTRIHTTLVYVAQLKSHSDTHPRHIAICK